MITVFTVITNGHDNLRPPKCIEPGVRYVCFSDVPMRCDPWEIQPAWRRYGDHRDSRIPKILAHLFTDSQYSIYHDGCFVLNARPSLLIERELQGADIAMYRHPCRKSIYEEAETCRREGIGDGPAMDAQVERYRAHGLRDGLWCGGFIIRRRTDLVTLLNEVWWKEYLQGCPRDQIAFPFARLSVGLKINTIDADILTDTPRLSFEWHAGFAHLGTNPQYNAWRKAQAERLARLEALCPK